MIVGFLENNSFKYNTSLKVIDKNNYILIIDGLVETNDYTEIAKYLLKEDYSFLNDLKDFVSIYFYNKKNNKLIIINDRIGSKKVYYYKRENKLYFGNSLNNLVDYTKEKFKINIQVLSMFFRYHYIPEPYTIYQNIFKLEHGHYMIFDKRIENTTYWDVVKLFNNRKVINNFNQVKKELNEILTNQIKNFINGKKNIGIYLSSGIDSSLISSIYKELYPNDINTFSIGFEIEKYNEANSSKEIANYLKTNHHELIIKNIDALNIIHKIFEYYDEPFGDSSAAATIILNEYAKKNNVKIALTGDGADQLFCGVSVYDFFYKINRYSKIINPFHIHLSDKLVKDNRLFFLFSKTPKNYRSQIDFIYDEKRINGLFDDNGQKRFDYDIKTHNLQEERMILDLDTFMAQRVLPKMTIAAKKNNIDIFSPYLSHKVIEYSFKIPHRYKYYKKNKKYILKKILFEKIPSTFFSSKKKGFGIPVREWLKTTLNDDLKRLSTKSYITKQNIFDYDKVQSLINDIDYYGIFVWDYYIFQLWYEKNKNRIIEKDV